MFHNKDYEEFKNELRKIITPDTVFVCVGTNKVIFDIFGPLCGSKLRQKGIPYFGDCKYNVNAVNMYDRLEEIYKINKLEIKRNRGVKPGAGMGKVFPTIGVNSVLMYTLLREDLEKVLRGYKNKFNGKRKDKADIKIIRERVEILTTLISEIYNEVCNENIKIK